MMEIIKEIKNDLLNRIEIEGILESEKNPSFEEVSKLVSKKTEKPEENIDVYNIKGSFGTRKFKIFAYVYNTKEDKEKAEQKTKKQREKEMSEKNSEIPPEENSENGKKGE